LLRSFRNDKSIYETTSNLSIELQHPVAVKKFDKAVTIPLPRHDNPYSKVD